MSVTQYSGEDAYQNSRKDENAKMHIYTTIYLNDVENMNLFILEHKKGIDELINNHFKHNPESRDYILKVYKIKEENQDTDDFNLLWEKISETNPEILEIHYNITKKRITLVKDHRYFGGLFFLKLGAQFTDTHPVTIYKEYYFPFISELLIGKFAIDYYTKRKKSQITFNPETAIINRNYFNFETVKKEGIRTQTLVMLKILETLSLGLDSKIEYLNLLIPVAFESTKKNYNNVGGIFIQYDIGESPESFEKKLMNVKYQAVATNNLQRIMNGGKKARQSIDVVFTCGCLVSNDKDNESNLVNKTITSYLSVAHYPIYILAMTINNKCHVTITSMTSDLNLKLIHA